MTWITPLSSNPNSYLVSWLRTFRSDIFRAARSKNPTDDSDALGAPGAAAPAFASAQILTMPTASKSTTLTATSVKPVPQTLNP